MKKKSLKIAQKALFLFSILVLSVCTAKAQSQDLYIRNNTGVTVNVVFYMENGCTSDGVSNVISVPSTGTSLLHYSFNPGPFAFPSGFWATTPSNDAVFANATVQSSCSSSSSAPGIGCPYFDFAEADCRPTAPCYPSLSTSSCLTLSTACGSASPGKTIFMDWTSGMAPGGAGFAAVLDIHYQ